MAKTRLHSSIQAVPPVNSSVQIGNNPNHFSSIPRHARRRTSAGGSHIALFDATKDIDAGSTLGRTGTTSCVAIKSIRNCIENFSCSRKQTSLLSSSNCINGNNPMTAATGGEGFSVNHNSKLARSLGNCRSKQLFQALSEMF